MTLLRRAIMILFLLLCGCASTSVAPIKLDLNSLPVSGVNAWNRKGPIPISVGTWNLGGFIPAAMSLQAMGRQAGGQALLVASENSASFTSDDYEKVIVLCRMLFKFIQGVVYRYPSLGYGTFFGGTTIDDWPTEPIEVVDGYPFWIAQGYYVAGYRGPVADYVSYCITNCEWNTFKYRPLSTAKKRAALAKLLSSRKWKRPLEKWERETLSSQIEWYEAAFYTTLMTMPTYFEFSYQ
jgi:hypothetical protein